MDDDSARAAAGSEVVVGADAAAENLLQFGSLRLRPLWVGLALTGAGFLLCAAGMQPGDRAMTQALAGACALPSFIYYLMTVHRVIRVLDAQPGWAVGYTPAAAVVKHFIPFYAIYFLYRWPRDVGSFIDWKMGYRSRVAVWAFPVLVAGFLVRFFDGFVGLALIFVSLYFVYVPLRRALGSTT